MPTFAELWLPIVLSGVGVWLASSILHMLLPIHKGDYGQLPGEEQLLESMRSLGVNPGQYMFPWCGSMKELGTEEGLARFQKGPVGWMVVLPSGPPRMGRSLLQWFFFTLLVGVIVAYVATVVLPKGAEYLTVFRVTGTVALAAYGIGVINDSIWKGVRWGVTLKFVFDGFVYALVVAGCFAGFWPAAGS